MSCVIRIFYAARGTQILPISGGGGGGGGEFFKIPGGILSYLGMGGISVGMTPFWGVSI